MRFWMLGMTGLLFATAALGADCGSDASGEVLRLEDWHAVESEGMPKITIEYSNATAQALVMVEAAAWFYDALGESIGGMKLNRDPNIASGSTASETSLVLGLDRLLAVDHSNVDAVICVEAALYGDGGKVDFAEINLAKRRAMQDQVDALMRGDLPE
jgi:hypothetical protein